MEPQSNDINDFSDNFPTGKLLKVIFSTSKNLSAERISI